MGRVLASGAVAAALTLSGLVAAAQAQNKPLAWVEKRKVTLELKKTPLRKALALLFEEAQVPVVVDDNVPDVPISGRWADKPLWEAFSDVSRQLSSQKPRIQAGFGSDACLVTLNPNSSWVERHDVGPRRKVFLSFKNVPFRRGVDMIFLGSGVPHEVDRLIPNLPITVELKDVTVEKAIIKLALEGKKQIPGLRLVKDGDVFGLWMASK